MANPDLPENTHEEIRAAWHRYIDLTSPFRPELHRYCRRLTRNPWDAEDLVQDTLLRAFATLGMVNGKIQNARGYLVRTATHLWIDTLRRRNAEAAILSVQAASARTANSTLQPAVEVRDAGEAVFERLAPQERAALVLKEVFGMSLKEIAATLGTSVGAVKSALHRGRGQLKEQEEQEEPVPSRRLTPSPELVDRFVELLNASDLKGLLSLMLDSGSVEMPGVLVEVGREQFESKGGWFWQAVHVHPELAPEIRPKKWWNERAIFRGEPVMLSFSTAEGGKLLQAVTRLEERDGQIARVRAYLFSPETVSEVAQELNMTVGQILYRSQFSSR
jgi:RNA polymerase sigma-70 factor (ECF subfamily)